MNILLIIFDGLADRPAPELKGRTPLAAARSGLGHLRGADFMPVLLNAAERTNMYEMRPTAHHRLYRPDWRTWNRSNCRTDPRNLSPP